MNDILERLLQGVPLTASDSLALQSADPSELDDLFDQVRETAPDIRGVEQLVMMVAVRIRAGDLSWNGVRAIAELYDATAPDNPGRGALLQFLVEDGSEEAIAAVARRLINNPPHVTAAVAQTLSPLYRSNDTTRVALQLVEECWDALEHLSVASPLLDLMNYLCRQRDVPHPAKSRAEQLRPLLRAIVHKLAQLAEQAAQAIGEADEQIQQMVEEGVPLAVSLCDALALIEDDQSRGILNQAMNLQHRRIRTEAAWALAKLGDDIGQKALLEQTADPYTRLRALQYLEELEQLESVEPEYLTDCARAEAALAAWLGERTQFGIPPHEIELVDERTLFWPGYDDEQDCYLFRYTYRFPQGVLTNYGLAGPIEHAFATDITHMEVDDVYAMFAGWHADHEEIEDAVPEQLSPAGQVELERLVRRMRDHGLEEIQPALFCQFFGDKAMVAQAVDFTQPSEQQRGWAVADALDVIWLPTAPRFGPVEASYVYKGRRLIRAFNEEGR